VKRLGLRGHNVDDLEAADLGGDAAILGAAAKTSQEAGPDRNRIERYAAALSGSPIRCSAPQAQGMSSSMREAGQRLTSFVSTSAK
jgi:hypothetical protein